MSKSAENYALNTSFSAFLDKARPCFLQYSKLYSLQQVVNDNYDGLKYSEQAEYLRSNTLFSPVKVVFCGRMKTPSGPKKSGKKIVLVANTTWNIYNFRLNVLEKLQAEGYDIFVIAPVDKFIHYKKKFPGVAHIPLKRLKRDSINPFRDLLLTLELSRLYRRIKPDILLHYTVKPNLYGGIAARLNRIPSLAVVTGLGYAFIHNGWIKIITKLLYKLTSRFHSKIIFENIDDRILFEEEGLIKADQGISIKGCGVNSTYFAPYPNGVLKDHTTFTFIGRLIYDKGINEFVEAARLLKKKYDNVRFWMVGEVDNSNPAAVQNDDLNEWIREKVITYHGSTEDVRKYIAASDCIVLPSYREAIARSLTEAMSMEKTVIATSTPGCREAVDDGKNGFLVPVKNATALAETMEKFHNLDADSRHDMGEAGRKKVLSEFDDKLIADQIFQIIESTIHEG